MAATIQFIPEVAMEKLDLSLWPGAVLSVSERSLVLPHATDGRSYGQGVFAIHGLEGRSFQCPNKLVSSIEGQAELGPLALQGFDPVLDRVQYCQGADPTGKASRLEPFSTGPFVFHTPYQGVSFFVACGESEFRLTERYSPEATDRDAHFGIVLNRDTPIPPGEILAQHANIQRTNLYSDRFQRESSVMVYPLDCVDVRDLKTGLLLLSYKNG